jgi:hypothetical protein
LGSLVNGIRVGLIGLPDIQHLLVWSDAKVRDLFDSTACVGRLNAHAARICG